MQDATSNRRAPHALGVYPYQGRGRWLLAGRYSHLVRALRDHPALDDPVVRQRAAGLRSWNLVRFLVSIPLSAGVVATAASALERLLPDTGAESAIGGFLGVLTGATGVLTIVYLVLTRLLAQLEADLLARLILHPQKRHDVES